MADLGIEYREDKDLPIESVLKLYKANNWSSAEKPRQLYQALRNSHALVSAWHGSQLVGLGNTISDGYLVVYYSHLLVLPEFQRKGIGFKIMNRLKEKYAGFHQHILIAEDNAVKFYEKIGFARAGKTVSMWVYQGEEH